MKKAMTRIITRMIFPLPTKGEKLIDGKFHTIYPDKTLDFNSWAQYIYFQTKQLNRG